MCHPGLIRDGEPSSPHQVGGERKGHVQSDGDMETTSNYFPKLEVGTSRILLMSSSQGITSNMSVKFTATAALHVHLREGRAQEVLYSEQTHVVDFTDKKNPEPGMSDASTVLP